VCWNVAALAFGADLRGTALPILPEEKRFVRLQRNVLSTQQGAALEVSHPLICMPDLLHTVASMIRRISKNKNPLVLGNGTVSLADLEVLYNENSSQSAKLQALLRPGDFAPVDRQNVSSALRLIHSDVVASALADKRTHHLGIYLACVADYFHAVHTPSLSMCQRIELLSGSVIFTLHWLWHCRGDLKSRAVRSSKMETASLSRYCFSSSSIRALCLVWVNFVVLAQWFGTSAADCIRDVLPAMTWLFCRCAEQYFHKHTHTHTLSLSLFVSLVALCLSII